MSQSTNAYLFYGITSDNEYDPVELHEKLCGALGIKFKTPSDEDDLDLYTLVIENDKINEVLGSCGLSVATHCSIDYPMLFIYVGEYKSAYRGSSTIIDLPLKDYTGSEVEKSLQKLATELGWEKPNWHLVSDWC
jgi:hypothetical protein